MTFFLKILFSFLFLIFISLHFVACGPGLEEPNAPKNAGGGFGGGDDTGGSTGGGESSSTGLQELASNQEQQSLWVE